ncbi:tRNA:m(4)X modification enzyme TRM13 homolog [Orussus abietinus]|uniref:tRNA:m(4)X modification enzyme TRM13 homolog n=1 Tax=Orussus abietinus TaxID=222816 RepID=UPI0006256F6B|nr:tRNA:m(4)X modification enzyme TRM13 homolog [Orussus abietinus]
MLHRGQYITRSRNLTHRHCRYFLTRKKRYCRMTVKNGNEYCGEHLENELRDVLKRKRIKCPLDPTHTCYASKLVKHLTVCNKKKFNDALPAYIVEGVNTESKEQRISTRIPLSQVDRTILEETLKKLNEAYENLPVFSEVELSHEILKKELQKSTYGRETKKHLRQNASLLAHLANAGLVRDNTCFIEFGAGKGKLTYWLAQIIRDQRNSAVLLVDRSSHRNKSDNKLRNEVSSLDTLRIRADIADLKLGAVPEIQRFHNKVAIAKHLCGAATDLTLRCLAKAIQQESEMNINGIVIAFCCHHRCDYNTYVGTEYLSNCRFTPKEFQMLCSIASWATCGSRRDDIDSSLPNDREDIGRRVKILLNWGRLEYLKTLGFHCQLLYYVPTDVSLENMCIIATKCPI